MGDAPGELDLLLEALEEGRVAREGLGPQQLQGHDLVELPVARAVHDAHPALAQRAEDLVAVGEDLPAAEDGAGGGHRQSSAHPRRGWPPDPGRCRPPPGRRRWVRARDRRLAHRRHALAQERDHLVLLAQVGEQAVEGAGQDADLVPALHRDGAGVGAVADPLDQADELAHGPGDARGGAPGGEEPQRHDAERHEDEAVAELAEGGGLRGEAAQRERGPDLLAAGGLQRYPHADVAVAVEVDLEGRHLRPRELRAGEGGGKGGLARPQGRDGQARRLPGGLDEKGDLAVGEPADLGGDRLVEAVPGDEHADELGPGLHGDRHRGEELVALAPQRRGVLAVEGAAHDRVGREVVAAWPRAGRSGPPARPRGRSPS